MTIISVKLKMKNERDNMSVEVPGVPLVIQDVNPKDTLTTVVVHRRRQVGAVIARKLEDGKVVLAWSKCLVKPTRDQRLEGIEPDKFDKNKALACAFGRIKSKKYALTVTVAEHVNQYNAHHIPSVIRPALRAMAARARRYFKDGVFEETMTEEELALGADPTQKIATIKAIRARTGLGLREAKELYEKNFPNESFPAGSDYNNR